MTSLQLSLSPAKSATRLGGLSQPPASKARHSLDEQASAIFQQQKQPSSLSATRSSRHLSVSAIAERAAGNASWSFHAPQETVDLCIFPMWSMPLPTSSGSLSVYEPNLVALLQVVQQVAAASLDSEAKFGVLPYDWVQRQLLMEDTVVPPSLAYLGDIPLPAFGDLSLLDRDVVGVTCDITGLVEEPESDGVLAQYSAVRRFKPVQVMRRKPFLVVRGVWVEDDKGKVASSFDGKTTEELEQEVWLEVQEIVKYTAKLQGKPQALCCGGADAALPESICKVSPVAAPRPTTAEERVKAWMANPRPRVLSEVAVWRKMKPTTAVVPKTEVIETEPALADPYLAASEKISRSSRQEAFSFAAASLVELGPEQRMELLEQTSTAQRLHWLLQAIEPHLGALKAEAAMRQALGDL